MLLRSYAVNPIFFDNNPTNDSEVFELGRQSIPSIANIVLVDATGKMISGAISSSSTVDYADRQWYQSVVNEKEFIIGEFVIGKTTGMPIFPVAYPVLNSDNEIVSIFSVGIDTQWIYDQVEPLSLPEGTTLTIIDIMGNILARYPDPEKYIGTIMPAEMLSQRFLETKNSPLVLTGLDGEKRYYQTTLLENGNAPYGAISIGFPSRVITERTRGIMLLNISLVVIAYLVTLSILLISLREKIIKPSKNMLFAFKKLTDGKSTYRLPLLPGNDEMSELVKSFNIMASELQTHRELLNEKVKERTIELENIATELSRSNHDLEQFAYVASHDLQEPLRMVASFTQLLEKRYSNKLDDKAHQYIQFAVDGAQRMQALINDLLVYSRVGTQAREFEVVDVNSILENVLKNLSTIIENSNATIQIGEMPLIYAEKQQIGQVFQNLISNAIKFHGDSDPVVEISATQVEEEWVFRVKDNGIGIDQQFFDRIFVVFQRLHNRETYSGTGIGLAIVKKIVERHEGKIGIESEIGQGSTFIFTIPKTKEEEIIHG